MKPIAKTIAVLIIFGIFIGAAYAQFSRPEDAIKYRQSVMVVIAQHFGRMGAMVKGTQPYVKKKFAENSAVVEALAGLAWEAFIFPGSDEGRTTMKSSVLTDPDEFNDLSKLFEFQVDELAAAAKAGDLDAIKTGFGTVAQSCKKCHSKSRK